jgi:chaperone required for assembly of F1-ATPase
LPSYSLALAVAAEWDAQTDSRKGIEPVTMPMMTLASTAIDQVAVDPQPIINNVMKYLHTDSALYFTNETDRILLSKQREHLTPAIDWLSKTLDVKVETTRDVATKLVHPPKTVDKIFKIIQNMDNFTLTCLQCATMECKSLVLGLNVIGR